MRSLFPQSTENLARTLNQITSPIWGKSYEWSVFGNEKEQTVRCYNGPSEDSIGIPQNAYGAFFKTMKSFGIFNDASGIISVDGPGSYSGKLTNHTPSAMRLYPIPCLFTHTHVASALERFVKRNQKEFATRLRAFTVDPNLTADSFLPIPRPASGMAALQERWNNLLANREHIIPSIKQAISEKLKL